MRPFRDSDLPSFLGYRSDPEVARYQSWDVPYGVDQAAAVIAEMKAKTPGVPGEWYQIAIELKPTGEHIGDCAFHIPREDPGQAEIGFTLSRASSGARLRDRGCRVPARLPLRYARSPSRGRDLRRP